MTSSTVSFSAQTKQQSTQLLDLRNTLNELQRQVTTQKKHENLSGFGTDAQRIQRLRTDNAQSNAYIDTVDRVTLRTTQMSDAMLEISRVAREVTESFTLQTQNGEVDIDAIRTVAQQNLVYLQDLLNSKHGDVYLFAGNASLTAPFDNDTVLNNNIQNEITDWLAGGQTPTQLTTDIEALSGTALGYSTALGGSGDVHAKVDTNVEVNYTVKADSAALTDIVRNIALAANLQYPDPSVDVATDDEFHQIIDSLASSLAAGADALDQDNYNLSNKAKLMQNIQNRHIEDRATLENLIGEAEDVDTTEVLVQLQALQTQMTASFEATNIINSLTLVNFL